MVEVRETRNQIDDLMNEIRIVVDRGERTLVTTLTKKMSEDLTDYLLEMGFKVRYLHSEIDTLERIQIIRDLRLGEYDVLVGVNLLREGLDLPEVSLVAILDADKEGFLRGETSLIQTIGRAARNIEGKVLMYADKETDAMRAALGETDRRRAIQLAYNEEHGITAATIVKGISDIAEFLQSESKVPGKGGKRRRRAAKSAVEAMTLPELEQTLVELEEEMLAAAEELRFEYAARMRDEIRDLRRELLTAQANEAPAALSRASPRAACRPRSSPGTTADRARPAVAAHARSLRDPRLGVHGPADAGRARARALRALAGALADGAALAAATPAEVLTEWVGLGYNQRALRLRAACAIVARDGWPRDSRGLRALPGVGPYTAAAVASFAFGERVAAVDTNVRRVAARLAAEPAALLPARPPRRLEPGRDGARRARLHRPRAALRRAARRRRGARRAAASRPRRARRGAPAARARFEDTDRWARGRVVAALAAGDGLPARIAPERLERVLAGLERDGLIERDGTRVGLPGAPR